MNNPLTTGTDDDITMSLNKLANSTAMFMGTYIVAWFIYQLAVMYTASLFNIPSVLKYYELKFLEPNSSPLWSEMNIVEITFSGPLISLITGFISFIVLKTSPKLGQQLKLFLMWFCINSLAEFFGAFVAGFITRQGFGYVIAWMFIPYTMNLIISIVFLSVLVYLGILLIPVLLSISESHLGKLNGLLFILSRFTLPWLIGTGILILLKIPNAHPQHRNIFHYDIIIILSMAFVVLPPLLIKYINYRRSLSLKGTGSTF
jgi:hypothetical protein